MNRSMRKRSGAFLVVLSALVGIAQVASADHSELIAGANAKKEACDGYNSKEARNCVWSCDRVSAELTRKPDADTAYAEGLKAYCDATYEAVGFGTADAPAVITSMPDVIGIYDGRGTAHDVVILAPDRQDWTESCRSRVPLIKSQARLRKGDRVRVVGISHTTAENARSPCEAQEIVPL